MRFFTHVLALALTVLALVPAGATAYSPGSYRSPSAITVQVVPAAGTTPTLNVYPNPGRGLVSVQLAAPHGQDYKFRLSNVLGRELRLLALRPEFMAESQPLDVSNLPAGLYFYSLLVNDKVVSTNRLTLQ